MRKRVICIGLLVVLSVAIWQWIERRDATDDRASLGVPYSHTHFAIEISSVSRLLGLSGRVMGGRDHLVKIPGVESTGTGGRQVQRLASDHVFGRIDTFTVQAKRLLDMASRAKYTICVAHRGGIATSIEIQREGGSETVAGKLQKELSKRFPKIPCNVVRSAPET